MPDPLAKGASEKAAFRHLADLLRTERVCGLASWMRRLFVDSDFAFSVRDVQDPCFLIKDPARMVA